MSDAGENLEEDRHDDEDEEDEEEGGMRAAYSIGDLAGLDDDDDGENPEKNGETKLTPGGRSQSETETAGEPNGIADDSPKDGLLASDHHDNDISEANRHDDEKVEDSSDGKGVSPLSSVTETSSGDKGNSLALNQDNKTLNEDTKTLNQDNEILNQDNKTLNHDNGQLNQGNEASSRDNGAFNEDGGALNRGTEEDGEIYPSPAEIRERKRESKSDLTKSISEQTNDVDNPSYANVGPNGPGSSPLGENHYEDVYENAAEKGEMEKGGTLVPGK